MPTYIKPLADCVLVRKKNKGRVKHIAMRRRKEHHLTLFWKSLVNNSIQASVTVGKQETVTLLNQNIRMNKRKKGENTKHEGEK